VGVSELSQASVLSFNLRQRRWQNSREVKDVVQVRLSEGEFCVLHLTFKGDDRAKFYYSKLV